jgi:type IV pilus assembly protein PilC
MPSFQYKAVDDSGKVFKGVTIAFDETAVERTLNSSGLSLIRSKVIKESALADLFSGSIKLRTLVEFYHRLAQTLEIGLPILSALEENGRYLPSKRMRKISSDLRLAVEGGKTLYEAMATYPKVFSKLDLAIIHMGEQAGVLPDCLKKMALFSKWKDELRSHIRRATIYPAFVIVAIIAVLAVWVGYVLPQMINVLMEMEVTIPKATIMVLRASQFAKANWHLLGGSAAFLIVFIYIGQKTRKGGLLMDKLLLKLPLLGKVLRNIAMARLCHNFATMLSAGISIQQIFGTLSDNGLGNRFLEHCLKLAYREIEGGESIADALDSMQAFPKLLIGAVRNGETTGNLDATCQRLGDYFDEEVKNTIQAMLNALEPMTIVTLGGVFGLIVLSILLPLYDVLSSMGNAY